jgi:hypothetical protein
MTHRINLEPKHTIISSGNGPKSFRFDLLSAAVCHLNASDYQSTLIFDPRKLFDMILGAFQSPWKTLFAVNNAPISFGADKSCLDSIKQQ